LKDDVVVGKDWQTYLVEDLNPMMMMRSMENVEVMLDAQASLWVILVDLNPKDGAETTTAGLGVSHIVVAVPRRPDAGTGLGRRPEPYMQRDSCLRCLVDEDRRRRRDRFRCYGPRESRRLW
jgi:hypothetical protein